MHSELQWCACISSALRLRRREGWEVLRWACLYTCLCVCLHVSTRRPASADRTARRQFQATGQPVSRTEASDAMTSRLPRWGEVCATQVLPMGVGPFAFRYQGNGATPCQDIDTTRNAIDCATTLPLTVFIQWNFTADFSSFIVEIVSKTTNVGNLSPFWGS